MPISKKFYLNLFNYNFGLALWSYYRILTQKYEVSENVLKKLVSIILKYLKVINEGLIFLLLNQPIKYLLSSYL